ncbi:probable endo-polygalacturonase 6 [Cephalotrichum gorgonifer]|uniref:Dehydrogenase FUB6 n=1 Tax=Cephalotrichum gorgonifer TaxID=2041049 RepID=A0AAE8SVY8_9PEZI|nr:probable endo-polygalacturonase 6 [Cephalotrichum gorgonifer]
MARENLQIVLAERPVGDIVPGQTFHQKTVSAPKAEDLKDGQILVENIYLSLDPAMRGWLNDTRSYLPPVPIGGVMRGATISRVIASKIPDVKPGTIIRAFGGWQEFSVLGPKEFDVPTEDFDHEHITDLLSVLGMTALTAYFGLLKIGDPKPGETVVVSGAAGATGSLVGQIAKLKGARVVGIAGGQEKAKYLTEELGFDVGLDYKAPDFKEKFKEATKDHIDVYFDNVGGEILELALSQAKEFARFVMCGAISQYNSKDPKGPRNITNVIAMRIKMQGFIVFDFINEYPQARKDLAEWVKAGKIKRKETVVTGGLKVAEQALLGLFKGTNTGKLLVELKNPKDLSKL